MPVPSADAPQWVVNLGVVAAAISTAVTGFILSRREKKSDRPEPQVSGVTVLGGSLGDSRTLDRLSDALGHVERATRDGERATIDCTHELKRVGESLADIRQGMDSRDRHMESDVARMMAAIEANRGKPGA